MSLFLPFGPSPVLQTYRICSLCDKPAMYTAYLRIRAFDPGYSKTVATEIDLYVCEIHAACMDIQIDKTLKAEKKTLIIFGP